MALDDLPHIISIEKTGFNDPILPGARIRRNGLVVLDATGQAMQAVAAPNLLARGIASKTMDNQNGDFDGSLVSTRIGVFAFDNSIDDPITRADIGNLAYIFDETTACRTSTGKSVAGRITQIDSNNNKVHVEITGVSHAITR